MNILKSKLNLKLISNSKLKKANQILIGKLSSQSFHSYLNSHSHGSVYMNKLIVSKKGFSSKKENDNENDKKSNDDDKEKQAKDKKDDKSANENKPENDKDKDKETLSLKEEIEKFLKDVRKFAENSKKSKVNNDLNPPKIPEKLKELITFLSFCFLGWVLLMLILFNSLKGKKKRKEISNLELIEFVKKGLVSSISCVVPHDSNVNSNQTNKFVNVYVNLNDNQKYYTGTYNINQLLNQIYQIQKAQGKSESNLIPINNSEDESNLNEIILSTIGLSFIGYLIFKRKMKMMNLNKSNKTDKSKQKDKDDSDMNPFNFLNKMQNYDIKEYGIKNKIDVKFENVAGMDSAKKEIMEFVDFLKTPEKYTKLGAKIPRGALLVGPPGTGKTLLAKATAGEAGVPFFSMSGSEFVEMFVGVGASRVRQLFKKAKDNAPSIIFIDEIDAIGKSRSGMNGNDEKDNTLNQLLVEMDGFGTETNVVVLAATNFAKDLDSALMRPGRFDRKIEVLLPDIKEREQLFMLYLKKVKLDTAKSIEEYAKRLATLTPGFSGADISNLVNEAAIISARNNKESVGSNAFEQASERVIAGLETKRPITEETKRIIAIHESGHAIVSWLLENSNPLVKVTIVPRSKGSLGFNQFMSDDKVLHSKEFILDEICTLLGGRIAEEILIGSITTGASNDLERITQLAQSMVMKFGMSNVGLQSYKEEGYSKPFSREYEDVSKIKYIIICIFLRKLMKK